MPGPLSAETDRALAQLENPVRTILARLSKNAISPDADTFELADFVECDFAGYAPIRLLGWTPEGPFDDDAAELFSPDLVWTAEAGIVPQQITAVYVTISGPGEALRLAQAFPLEQALTIELEGQTYAKRLRAFSNNVVA